MITTTTTSKGDTSKKLTMETFLKSLDTSLRLFLTAKFVRDSLPLFLLVYGQTLTVLPTFLR